MRYHAYRCRTKMYLKQFCERRRNNRKSSREGGDVWGIFFVKIFVGGTE